MDGKSIKGVPFDDDSSSQDSSGCEDNVDSTNMRLTNHTADSNMIPKTAMETKVESKVSRFGMNVSSPSMPSPTVATSIKKTQTPTTSIESSAKVTAIKMKISTPKCKEAPLAGMKRTSSMVSKAFNPDESDEEEMPAEAKMRMRNLGKETPTAAGPNSFSKGRLGFCNRQKAIERELEQFASDLQKKNS